MTVHAQNTSARDAAAESASELLTLSDLNLYEFLRENVRLADGGEIVERDGMLLTLAADPFPGLSCVIRTGSASDAPAATLIDAANRYYTSHGRGWSIRTRGHLDADLLAECEARQYFPLGTSPGMVLRAALPEPSALPCELRVARDLPALRDFVQVVASSYATLGLPEAACLTLMARAERLLAPHVQVVVAYRQGAPVSAALGFLSHGIGGVYWVGTVPAARGLGTAAHCTRAVSNFCFANGARSVVLQASRQGEPIYRALGFEVITRYPWFLYMPPQP